MKYVVSIVKKYVVLVEEAESKGHAYDIAESKLASDPKEEYLIDGSFEAKDIHEDLPSESDGGKLCKTCQYFQFKFSGDHAWGQCLHPKIIGREFMMIDIDKLDYVQKLSPDELIRFKDDVKSFGRIIVREDAYGCILHSEERMMK